MSKYETEAHGKINLGLDVTGRRPNGYHEVCMIMQSVGLHDELCFETASDSSITLTTDAGDIPTDGTNLVCRAIDLIRCEYSIPDGVHVTLRKNLPVAAGMAGGSSDAAAALRAMNALFSLGLDDPTLASFGVRLGADIPYCIAGGTALAEGIGEVLTPLNPMPDCSILLIKPDISVSTPVVYRGLDERALTVSAQSGHPTDDINAALGYISHPDINAQLKALSSNDLHALCANMGNLLEPVTCAAYPVITEIRSAMIEEGAISAMMSGSGPTVFGIYDDPDKAAHALRVLREKSFSHFACVTEPF